MLFKGVCASANAGGSLHVHVRVFVDVQWAHPQTTWLLLCLIGTGTNEHRYYGSHL